MICHHNKCIFVHIPKNAGQSIEHVFLDLLGLKWETRAPLLLRSNDAPELGPPRLAHLKASEYVNNKYLTEEMFSDYFKFSFVRNPWDRMVSMYKYMPYSEEYEFKYFVKKVFRKKIWEPSQWFVGPQSQFVCDDNNNIIVDYVGKFETLQNDFNHVCKKIGLPNLTLPHVNKTEQSVLNNIHPTRLIRYLKKRLKQKSTSKKKNYYDYYDNEARDIVGDLYANDVELFGYKFGE